MNSRLRICIDARSAVGGIGGTGTFALSLSRALLNLNDGDEQYIFLIERGDRPQLEGLLNRSIQVIEFIPSIITQASRIAPQFALARMTWRRVRPLVNFVRGKVGYSVARSDGTVERSKIDIIHFTTQSGFLTNIPFIYHPHDLQHRHLPQFFTSSERASRDFSYSTLCNHASVISVVSRWVKQDLLQSFNVPESKVRIVHFAPDPHNCLPLRPETARAIVQKLSLPQRFIFYPARTWPHKNHLRLIQALRILRDDYGLTIPLVCSGETTGFYEQIKAEVENLALGQQVSFIGFVSFEELSALYQLCSAVIIPTLFEAGSFPMWEAFLNDKPAACSSVTSLQAQAGDAALIFDPNKPEEIADAIRKLWTDIDLCATLIARGRVNVTRFSWEKTARTFRALYRQLGGRQITSEDELLLSAPPLM